VIPCEDEYGFVDSAEWEEIKEQGDAAIEAWIAEQLDHTSVTAVLIGAETADRDWVRHELVESWNRGNGILGIWIHNIRDQKAQTDTKGRNPLDEIHLPNGKPLSSVCKTYDWVDDGRENLGSWIEEAYQTRRGQTADLIKDEFIPSISAATQKAAPPRQQPPRVFTPQAPWCQADVDLCR
jgi:MTH538 TIR-like domain (DUF1863)